MPNRSSRRAGLRVLADQVDADEGTVAAGALSNVARIRRRLGAGSRSEMLSMLRATLAPDDAVAGQRDQRTVS